MGNRLSHSRRSTLLFASSYLHLGTPLPWLSECGISDIGRPSLPTRIHQRSNRDRCTGFAARAAAWSMQLARPHVGPVVSHLAGTTAIVIFLCRLAHRQLLSSTEGRSENDVEQSIARCNSVRIPRTRFCLAWVQVPLFAVVCCRSGCAQPLANWR